MLCIGCANRVSDTKISYYESGKVKAISRQNSGRQYFQDQVMYENGGIDSIQLFVGGMKDAHQYKFYENGNIKYFRFWNQGRLEGWALDFYNDSSRKTSSVSYYRHGILLYIRKYSFTGQVIFEKNYE
jgi:antitoxin component YwqK of YwqJK toxin-antitoxin module